MNLDFSLDQGDWLIRNVNDVQRHGGVCHAMTTEWVFAIVQNRSWNVQEEYWRGVSHQRAYALAWQDALRNLWGGSQYNQYLNIALDPTKNYVKNPASRNRLTFHDYRVKALDDLSPRIIALPAGAGIVIVMFGSNRKWPADQQNWGHTVAVARDTGTGMYRYIDVNSGQYSWPLDTPAITLGREVKRDLRAKYGGWGIRDIYIFRVAQA